MKIIAKQNPTDNDMIELYSVSERINIKKFLMGAVHIDTLSSLPICDRLNENEEVVLSLELAE